MRLNELEPAYVYIFQIWGEAQMSGRDWRFDGTPGEHAAGYVKEGIVEYLAADDDMAIARKSIAIPETSNQMHAKIEDTPVTVPAAEHAECAQGKLQP